MLMYFKLSEVKIVFFQTDETMKDEYYLFYLIDIYLMCSETWVKKKFYLWNKVVFVTLWIHYVNKAVITIDVVRCN